MCTIVSGYWVIDNKHKKEDFIDWFNNTLKINCPYVFFGDETSLNIIK